MVTNDSEIQKEVLAEAVKKLAEDEKTNEVTPSEEDKEDEIDEEDLDESEISAIQFSESSTNDWGIKPTSAPTLDQRMAITSASDFDIRGDSLEEELAQFKEMNSKASENVYEANNELTYNLNEKTDALAETHTIDQINDTRDQRDEAGWNPMEGRTAKEPEMYQMKRDVDELATEREKIQKYSL